MKHMLNTSYPTFRLLVFCIITSPVFILIVHYTTKETTYTICKNFFSARANYYYGKSVYSNVSVLQVNVVDPNKINNLPRYRITNEEDKLSATYLG